MIEIGPNLADVLISLIVTGGVVTFLIVMYFYDKWEKDAREQSENVDDGE